MMELDQKTRELYARNMQQVNSILNKISLGMLILCPVLFLTNLVGVTGYDLTQMIWICGAIAVLSLVPFLFCSRIYNENINRILTLTCMETVVCIVGLNPVVRVDMLYLLVPIVSVMYLQRDFFFRVARNGFFMMLIVEVIRFFMIEYSQDAMSTDAYQTAYENAIPLVLGYLMVMAVIYFLFFWLTKLVDKLLKVEPQMKQTRAATVVTQEEKPSDYHVKGLFLEVNQTVQGLIRGKDKSLVVNVDYDLPVRLIGRQELLKTAIVNMLSDFLKFTEQGTVTMSVTYDKGITPRKGQNITLVCNILCSEDLTDRIRDGQAMGFAMAKNIIRGMDGVLLDKTIEGAVTQTAYTVSLLQEVADEETLLMVKAQNKSQQESLIYKSRKKELNLLSGRKVKALIVDDSGENRRLVRSILKSYGIEADMAPSGQEAIGMIESKAYDFVIIDHMMPGKGGIQTAKEIRQKGEPYFELLPLMVMSSNVTDDSRQVFSESGFSEIISKPIKEEELRIAISRIYLA